MYAFCLQIADEKIYWHRNIVEINSSGYFIGDNCSKSNGFGDGDKVPKTYSDIRALSLAIHLYFLDHQELPDKLKKLHSRDNPKGKQYIAKEFKDPWGNSYIYRFTNKEELKSIFIYSLGENGNDENCSGDDECYPEIFKET